MSLTQSEIRERAAALGVWFHNIDLAGVPTAPNHFLHDYPNVKWRRFEHAIPADLSGKSVLDIGCNAGFYSMEMKLRGAERVLGIDFDDRDLEQARFAAEVKGADIELRRMSVYDVAQLGETFDIVLFMGVLYHLRHPLLALDLIHDHVAGDLLIYQSMQRGSAAVEPVALNYPFFDEEHFDQPGYPKLHFIEHAYADDWTNWWAPNAACSAAMLRSAGFDILERPEAEVFICRRAERPTTAGAVYPARPAAHGGRRLDRSSQDLERAEQQVALGSPPRPRMAPVLHDDAIGRTGDRRGKSASDPRAWRHVADRPELPATARGGRGHGRGRCGGGPRVSAGLEPVADR